MAESTKLNFSEGLKYYDGKLKTYINEKYLLKTDVPSISNMAFSIEQNGGIRRANSMNEELGINAMELGYNSHATGYGSVSIGFITQSIGTGSFAEG